MSTVLLPAICHEYSHFDRDCKKAQAKVPENPQSRQGDQSNQSQTQKKGGNKRGQDNNRKPQNNEGPSTSSNPFGVLQSSEATQLDSNENQTGEDEGIPEKGPIEEGIKYKS